MSIMSIWDEGIYIWEAYQDADRRVRYCRFKLGLTAAGERTKFFSPALQDELRAELERSEARLKALRGEMEEWLETAPVPWGWLGKVRGIGTVYGFSLLATVGDPRRWRNPSALWSAASVGLPRLGEPAAGRRKGRRRTVGFWPLAQTVRLVTRRLLMVGPGGFYYDFYRRQRARWETSGENLAPHVIHARSKLATMRLLLSHVLNAGRERLGLSQIPSYAAAKGHTDIPYTDVLPYEAAERVAEEASQRK